MRGLIWSVAVSWRIEGGSKRKMDRTGGLGGGQDGRGRRKAGAGKK